MDYYPYGGYRTSPTTGDITDRGFTGHRHNDSIGLIYMRARYYVPGVGRFASADTIVPDPANPQSYNRYSYISNQPIGYSDPSGHCAENDEDCWFYLEYHFCQNLYCGLDGWSKWVFIDENSIWTVDDLRMLHNALYDVILGFGEAGVDWQQTALADIYFKRDSGSYVSRSLPWDKIILGGSELSEHMIWHEIAHQFDWDVNRSLSYKYLDEAGGCLGVILGCNLRTPDGYYYTDYGWDARELEGGSWNIYAYLWGRMEPFADAFAAWIFESTYHRDPTGWTQGRASRESYSSPNWDKIYNLVDELMPSLTVKTVY